MPRLLSFTSLVLMASFATGQVPDRPHEVPDGAPGIVTDAGVLSFPAGAHPLAFWTDHPLDRRARNDLLIGINAPDGRPITVADYTLDQKVTTLGTLAGHRIVQILLSIHPGLRVSNWISPDQPPNPDETTEHWKTLLVQAVSGDTYTQTYGVQVGSYPPFNSATIVGTGAERILTTYDPDGGNGGGCADGSWWFDRTGAHPVDFSPLDHAIQRKLPPNTSYTGRCWAIHPEASSINSGVQRSPAECHSCGLVGEVTATYRIRHGQALPVFVTYTPSPNPD